VQRLLNRPQLVALGSAAIDLLLVVAKLAAGLLTGSLGLIGEAVHSSLDLAASGLAYFAVRTARKPADSEHPYGHGRAENVAAYTEGILILITAGVIVFEAARRLLGAAVHVDAAGYAIALVVLTIGLESVRGYALRWFGRRTGSPALEANATNRLADILAAVAVLAGLLAVRSGVGVAWADPVAALIVAGVIAQAAARLMIRSADVLIDRAATSVETDLRQAIESVHGVRDVSSVRVRRSGPNLLGEAHVATRPTLSLEGAENLADQVRTAVGTAMPNLDLTLVLEARPAEDNLVERVHAAAARDGRVRDLHNVTVEREDDGRLHLTMHAKLPGDMTLVDADSVSRELEARLRADLADIGRVDVHLEPLEPDLVPGEDVTARRPELAQRVRRLVEAHPAVLRCRDVELSSRDGLITAHVVAEMRPETPLERAHLVETELEDAVESGFPELHEVVARAAP
jgi:cation diffusion facilitator family transporter